VYIPIFTTLLLAFLVFYLNRIKSITSNLIFIVVLAGIFLRLIIATLNSTVGPLPGVDVDAIQFDMLAISLANNWLSSDITFLPWIDRYSYANVIGFLYFIDGISAHIPLLFNISLVTFAIYNTIQIARIFGCSSRNLLLIALLLSFHPIISLYSIAPMREAPLYALITYFFRVLLNCKRQFKVLLNAKLNVIIILSIYLHIGMVILYVILFAYSAKFQFKLKYFISIKSLLLIFCMFLFMEIAKTEYVKTIPRVAKLVSADSSYTFEQLKDVQEFKSRGEGAYTYPDVSTNFIFFDLTVTSIYMWYKLCFSPLPWEIKSFNANTFVKLIDSLLTIMLHILAFKNIYRSKHNEGAIFVYLSYLLLTLTFGMNTVNDGVAVRHRTKFLWLLVLVAFANTNSSKINNLLINKKGNKAEA
jgi:hypothetical protein